MEEVISEQREVALPKGVPKEEWDEAVRQVCSGGWDAGVEFFIRHPNLGFAAATTIQCELNRALTQIAALEMQVEELTGELAALREGATVTYRVEVFEVSTQRWQKVIHEYAHGLTSLEDAKECAAEFTAMEFYSDARITEHIVIERILDEKGEG
jgi:DNA-binding NarL/FixJ family response regulator